LKQYMHANKGGECVVLYEKMPPSGSFDFLLTSKEKKRNKR